MAKEDVRITKTKRDLRNGLVSLLKTRPFDKITVCDICSESMINRMTFYKHYNDKNDLLKDVFEYAQSKINGHEINATVLEEDVEAFWEDLLDKIANDCILNGDVLRSLIKHDNALVNDMIYNAIYKLIYAICAEYDKQHACQHLYEDIVTFVAGGFARILVDAIKNPDTDIDRMKEKSKEFFVALLESDKFFKHD